VAVVIETPNAYARGYDGDAYGVARRFTSYAARDAVLGQADSFDVIGSTWASYQSVGL
jgi:hypothetical protein